jgi:hypothetical protein
VNAADTPSTAAREETDGKVVNLAFYRLKKSLLKEGFELATDEDGKVTLVLRLNNR